MVLKEPIELFLILTKITKVNFNIYEFFFSSEEAKMNHLADILLFSAQEVPKTRIKRFTLHQNQNRKKKEKGITTSKQSDFQIS